MPSLFFWKRSTHEDVSTEIIERAKHLLRMPYANTSSILHQDSTAHNGSCLLVLDVSSFESSAVHQFSFLPLATIRSKGFLLGVIFTALILQFEGTIFSNFARSVGFCLTGSAAETAPAKSRQQNQPALNKQFRVFRATPCF